MYVQESVLSFSKVQQSDSSNYVCLAMNSLGEDRKKFKLTVVSEIVVFVRPQKQIVDSGSTAIFNCSVHGGRGQLLITWLKNGQPLSLSSKTDIQNEGEILVIYSVSRNDRGMYQCFVRSEDKSAQNSAELILGAVAPELKYVFSEKTLQPGRSISLKCVATGNPHARILWLLDGGLLYPQGDYILGSYLDNNEDVVSHLNISNVRVEHGGLYTCIARNILGSVQHSALLNIHGSPVSRQMMNLTVESGINVFLRCPASGYPISSTVWQFGDKQFTESRHRIFNNGTLLIEQVVGHKDQGEYTCTIKNHNDQSAVGRLFLTVMEPPEVQPFSFDSDLKEGNRAHVSCAIKSGDLPMEFTWRKDGRPLPPDPDVQQQNLQFISNLLFSKLSARHSGYYTCIVSNVVAVANYTAHLRIKVSPVWSFEPINMAVLFGQPTILNCQASGFPAPSVTWMKVLDKEKESLAEIDSSTGVILADNGSLFIQSTERHHEGYYQCNAKNGIGKGLTKTVFLKVNVPAHFRTKFLNQSGIVGEKVILTCEAEGDQPLRITWNTPPPAPIQTRHTATGLASELHLNYLSRSYAGTYHCTATNSFGYDHMSIHLAVKELPEAPQNIEVIDIESRALKLRWEEVSGPVSYYLIQYREENTQVWRNSTVSGDTMSAQISSLLPATTYVIRIMALNELGISEPSKSFTFSTLEEVPSGPPTNVEINVEENNLIVQWQPPHNENTNGAILGYEIEYREVGASSNVHRKTLKAHKTSVKLIGLKYYTSYEITVKAFNKVGVGPATLPIQQITTESVPSRSPQKIKCSAESSESLRLQWTPPPRDFHNGNIQGYKIFYKPANPEIGMKNINKIKKTVSTEAILHTLEKFTNYSIRILAYTHIGDGVKSLPIYCHTAEDLPEAPANIKALVMTSDSILVAWNPPTKTNGVIIKYHVYIEHPDKKIHKDVVYGEQKNLKHVYRNLKEHQYYLFWVIANTNVGEGSASVKVSQTPLSRVPAKIAAFSGKVITKIGTRISLDCSAVGLPSPTRIWWGPQTSSLFSFKTSEPVVWFGPITENDAGNYTCKVENVFGTDETTFNLVILLPPPPPVIFLSSTSVSSITILWKQTGNGGSPITGYLLSYAAIDTQNWENIELEPEMENYEIKQLRCGTDYQLFIQAFTSVAYSKASQKLLARTKGSVPDIAKQYEIMSVNSTSVTLYLDNWPVGECPILYFKVAYRNLSKWISVEPSRLPPETVIINGLNSATKYMVRITAVNEAGSSKYDYIFATRTESGEIIPIELMKEPEATILNQLNIIIPLVSAVLCVIAISTCIFILFRKKKIYESYKSGQQTLETSHLDNENDINNDHQRTYIPSPIVKENLMNTLNKDNKSVEYDVCPYATFSLPSQSASHCVKMRSFNQHDCYENSTVMEGHHSIAKRPKINHLKYPPDDFNIEISCISSQQTLPIGGKSRARIATFVSDSDSSIGKVNQRRYQQIQRNIRHTPPELDSSTESIETSPSMRRKILSNRPYLR